MFCLHHEVNGGKSRIHTVINDHCNFRWTSESCSDTDNAENLPLGFCHEGISRPGNHIHLLDALGAPSDPRGRRYAGVG